MQYIMGYLYLLFKRKNVYLRQRGQKLNTHLDVLQITLQTKSNFDKLYKWLDEQTELFTVSELHAKICSFAKKRSKCLLFKMQFNSFHRETWPFEHSLFYGYDKYHITGAMVQEKER